MTWEDCLMEHFFTVEGLHSLIPYFCKVEHESAGVSKIDIISSTVVTFLTSPVHLTMSELGISLFHNKSSSIFPYYLMTDEQKQGLLGLLESPSEYNIFNERVVFKRNSKKVTVPILSVLESLCLHILKSTYLAEKESRVGVCNIIMQRIQGYIPISTTIRKDLNLFIVEQTQK